MLGKERVLPFTSLTLDDADYNFFPFFLLAFPNRSAGSARAALSPSLSFLPYFPLRRTGLCSHDLFFFLPARNEGRRLCAFFSFLFVLFHRKTTTTRCLPPPSFSFSAEDSMRFLLPPVSSFSPRKGLARLETLSPPFFPFFPLVPLRRPGTRDLCHEDCQNRKVLRSRSFPLFLLLSLRLTAISRLKPLFFFSFFFPPFFL